MPLSYKDKTKCDLLDQPDLMTLLSLPNVYFLSLKLQSYKEYAKQTFDKKLLSNFLKALVQFKFCKEIEEVE